MTGRWLYAVDGPNLTRQQRTQLRRFINRNTQPPLVTLAVADNVETDNLIALYRDNPTWAAVINRAAAAWALLDIYQAFSAFGPTDKLSITATFVTEDDTNIS